VRGGGGARPGSVRGVSAYDAVVARVIETV
jgi:hypothetical protein